MDKIILKAEELSEELKKEPLIVEFLRVKEIFENDVELQKMRKLIAKHSKNKTPKEYKQYKEMYDNHPLVSNYYQLKEEVANLLEEIQKIIL